MTLDAPSKKVNITFNQVKGDSNFKVVKEGLTSLKASKYANLVTFTPDFLNVTLSLDFTANPGFKTELIREYGNTFSKSYRIKIVIPSQTVIPYALYVTFDFAIGETTADERSSFMALLNSSK